MEAQKRYEILRELHKKGKTQAEIARLLGVSRQRVNQLLKLHLPEYRKKYFKHHVERQKRQRKTLSPQEKYFRDLKHNVKQRGKEFNLSFEDLEYPDVCPVLGIPIDWTRPKRGDNSPSADRLYPERGYVKGNVTIMSFKANRMKNNGSLEEHELLVKWLRSKN